MHTSWIINSRGSSSLSGPPSSGSPVTNIRYAQVVPKKYPSGTQMVPKWYLSGTQVVPISGLLVTSQYHTYIHWLNAQKLQVDWIGYGMGWKSLLWAPLCGANNHAMAFLQYSCISQVLTFCHFLKWLKPCDGSYICLEWRVHHLLVWHHHLAWIGFKLTGFAQVLVIQMSLHVMPQVRFLPELVSANTTDKHFLFFADACDNADV